MTGFSDNFDPYFGQSWMVFIAFPTLFLTFMTCAREHSYQILWQFILILMTVETSISYSDDLYFLKLWLVFLIVLTGTIECFEYFWEILHDIHGKKQFNILVNYFLTVFPIFHTCFSDNWDCFFLIVMTSI